MVLTICWAAKGGSGTTVVSCALALLHARVHDTWLVDLAGDVPAALGMAEPAGAGVLDWVASTTAGQSSLTALAIEAAPRLLVLARGASPCDSDHPRWSHLGDAVRSLGESVVVDAGSAPPGALLAMAEQRLLVTRPCYLAIRRSVASDLPPPTGVVVVTEPGRALRTDDVAYALHAPVVAELTIDPAVARSVDAGLLATRLAVSLAKPLAPLVA